MPSDRFKKVQSGNPLEIPAATWNSMIDAAAAHASRQHDQSAAIAANFRQADIILVKNTSGVAIGRFGILGIDKPIIEPTVNLLEFKNQVALIGKKPADTHRGKFVILLDPLANNQIGRAWISGVCIARLKMDSANHKSADIETNTTDKLKSATDGSAQILWVESGTGDKWGVIRFGSPGNKIALVQAPSGGIPKRVGVKPGSATCGVLVVATAAGTGYVVGDLIKTGTTFSIKNWTFDIAAKDGDRIAQVEGHFDGAMVVGWSCTNTGSPTAFKTQS